MIHNNLIINLHNSKGIKQLFNTVSIIITIFYMSIVAIIIYWHAQYESENKVKEVGNIYS